MFDYNKCKECMHPKCLIGKSLIDTQIKLNKLEQKRKKLEDDYKYYDEMFTRIGTKKRTLSQNELNILEIARTEGVRINQELREIYQ